MFLLLDMDSRDGDEVHITRTLSDYQAACLGIQKQRTV